MKGAKRAGRIEYAIRDVMVPASRLEKEGHKILKLNIGDPNAYDFDTPEEIKEAFISAIRNAQNGYSPSEGMPELLEAIVEKEKQDNVKIEKKDIIVTNGVAEAIMMLFGATFEKGEEVMIPGPTYPSYHAYANFFDAVPVEYETMEENGWQPDIDDMRKKITEKTKAISIINPNNPTGALYSKSTIKEITDLAGEHDLFLVSDEIYDKLVYEDKCVSPAAVSKDIPVVVLNGVSKVFLAPGWRVGYMAFRDVDEKMEEIKEFVLKQARTRVSASRPAQLAYAAALRSRHDFVSATIKKMKERRDYAVKRINEIDGLSTQTPGGAFYTFPKIDCQNDKKWVLDLLQKKHVLVVHGSGFSQDYGKGHFRMVFLPPVDVLDEAFDRIEEFMKGD